MMVVSSLALAALLDDRARFGTVNDEDDFAATTRSDVTLLPFRPIASVHFRLARFFL